MLQYMSKYPFPSGFGLKFEQRTNTTMTHKQKQMMILAVPATAALLIVSIILSKIFPEMFGWKFFTGLSSVAILMAAYFSAEKTFMKILFFIAYHTLIFGTVWWISWTFIAPHFTDWSLSWVWYPVNIVLNGIRKTLIVIGQLILLGTFVYSILSCFSGKKLKKTDIGQWSTKSGWMPKWGKNEENSLYGLFLGMPEWIVEIQAIPKVSKVIEKTEEIQIEEHGSTEGKKFAAVFQFSFQSRVVDTYIHILRPNGDKDLVNLVITRITEWLNDSSHNYKNIKELKEDKANIQKWLIEVLVESGEMFGDEIENFRAVDIEDPKNKIEQQNKDAAARAAQLSEDEREKLNQENAIALAKRLVEESKDSAGKATLSFKEALNEGRLQLGITKSSQARIKGGKGMAGLYDVT